MDAYFAGVANFEMAPEVDNSPDRQRAEAELHKGQDLIRKTSVNSIAGAAAIALCIEHQAQINNMEEDYRSHIVSNFRVQLDKMAAGSKAPAKPDTNQ